MSEIGDEFVSTSSDDFGFRLIGDAIQLVSDYEEKLPFKHFNNFSYAPHLGLIAAAGSSELLLGTMAGLQSDIKESKLEYTADAHKIDISSINNVAFTKDEKYLVITVGNTVRYVPVDSTSYKNIGVSSFHAIDTVADIEILIPSPAHGSLCIVLDSSNNLSIVDLSSSSISQIATDTLNFSFSPKGKQVAIAKTDGSIRQMTLDGSETLVIERPEEVAEDNSIPLALSWVSTHEFFVIYGEPLSYDEEEEPSYDFKTFVITHDTASKTTTFKETFDAVPSFGTVWRRPSIYASSLHKLSTSLPLVTFLSSSTSAEVSAISTTEQLLPANDSERASLPINESTGNDVNAIGLITDIRIRERVQEPCAGISEAEWLPTVWVLGHDGKVQGWYVFHVHDLKNGSFQQVGPIAFEDELYNNASGGSSIKPQPVYKTSTEQTQDNSFGTYDKAETKPAFSFGNSNPSGFGSSGFGTSTFGSNTSGDSKSGFGQSSFGQSQTSNNNTSGFGSSTFGSSTTDRNKSGFGQSSFGQSSFGQSSFGQGQSSDNTAGFGSSGFGKTSNPSLTTSSTTSGFGSFANKSGASPFATAASKTSTNSPFAGLGGNKSSSVFGETKKDQSPFGSLNMGKDSVFGTNQNSESPFAAFSKTKESPFSKTSSQPLFGNNAQKTKSPFANLSANNDNKDSSVTSNTTNSQIPTSFNQESSDVFSFPKESTNIFESQTSAKENDNISDEYNSYDEDEDENSTDSEIEEKEEPKIQPSANAFNLGPTSFGSSTGSNNAFSAGSGFGSTAFKFGETPKPSQPASFEKPKEMNVSNSGFAAFANKKVDFGSKNIFAEIDAEAKAGTAPEDDTKESDSEQVEANQPEVEDVGKDNVVEEKEFHNDDLEGADQEKEMEEEGNTNDGELNEAADDTIKSSPEDSFQGFDKDADSFENIDDRTEFNASDIERELSFDEDEDESEEEGGDEEQEQKKESGSDEESEEDEEDDSRNNTTDFNEDFEEHLNFDEPQEDNEVDVDLKEDLDNGLNLDKESEGADSMKSSNEEKLYEEAKDLKSEEEENVDHVRVRDMSVQHQIESKDAEVDATVDCFEIAVQTDPIVFKDLDIQAFENEEYYIGAFDLPKDLPPYVHLKDVKYPKLSSNEIKQELEKMIYDTDAELKVIEENSQNMSDFIKDQLNPTVVHTEKSLGYSNQWRLSEAQEFQKVIESKCSAISPLKEQLEMSLKQIEETKSDMELIEKRSRNLKEKFISLESSQDSAVLNARELPFETIVLQDSVRASFAKVSKSLREAETKLLSLKTAANVCFGDPTNPIVLQGLVTHINNVTRDYASETRKLTQEISKMNKNHTKIIDELYDGKKKIFEDEQYMNRSLTRLKINESNKKMVGNRAISKAFRSKDIKDITTQF